MALVFVQCKENHRRREASTDEAALVNRTRSFQVVLSNHPDNVERSLKADENEVLAEFDRVTGIRRGSVWQSINNTFDYACRAVALTATQADEALTWDIEVTYTSGRASSGGGGVTPQGNRERAGQARQNAETGQPPEPDPTRRVATYTWGTTEYEEALERDPVTTEPIRNKAGDRFVPPPTRPLSYRTLIVEKNQLTFDPFETILYENTINSETWFIHEPLQPVRTRAPYTALCKSITAEPEHEGGVNFYRVTYVFWFVRNRTWKTELLNAGYQYLREPRRLETKMPFTDNALTMLMPGPQLLRNDGTRWNDGDPEPDPIEFNKYEHMDFNLLGL